MHFVLLLTQINSNIKLDLASGHFIFQGKFYC